VVVTDKATGTVIARCPVATDGTFDCDLVPPITQDGKEITVKIEDAAHNQSTPVTVKVDTVAPKDPVVDPSDGEKVTGHVDPDDAQDAAKGDLVVEIRDPDTGDVIATCPVKADGTFNCPIQPPLSDGDKVDVVVIDPSGNESDPVEVTADTVPPALPVVNPSDGSHIDGHVAPGDVADAAAGELDVVIKDDKGNEIARCPVKADGTFDCPISPKLPDGTEVDVVIEDAAGNQSAPVEIVTDGVAPGKPVVNPSDGTHVDGNVAPEDIADATKTPGLVVVITDPATGNELARCPVKADGTFDCPIVPPLTEDGKKVEVTIVDPAGNESRPNEIAVDTVAPKDPVVDPSDGNKITGHVDPDDVKDAAKGDLVVEIRDPNTGDVIKTCPVKADGTFNCVIQPPLADGDKVDVVVVDKAGNESTPKEVVADGAAPGKPTVEPSQGDKVTGVVPPADLADAAKGDLTVVVTDPVTGDQLCTAPVKADGTFECTFYPPLTDGKKVDVVVVDAAGNASDPLVVTTDSRAPSEPWIEPSDGTGLQGEGEQPGDVITVTGPNGASTVLCTTTVQADWTWSCDFSPALQVGDKVVVTETDTAKNVSRDKTWRIGVPEVQVNLASLQRLDRQTARGINFQPGELIQGTMFSDPLVLGAKRADSNGTVVFTWVIPIDAYIMTHSVELAGELSGRHSGTFDVVLPAGPVEPPSTTKSTITVEPPSDDTASGSATPRPSSSLTFTGTESAVGMSAAALAALLAGLLLVLASAKRRRREREEA
jgi:hypothetical protein